jgi:hypothetical protein
MTISIGTPHIGLVVEGPGDAGAVPILLRMHQQSLGDYQDVLYKPAAMNGRDKGLRQNGIEGFVKTVSSRPGCVGVLVTIDSEGDDVKELGPVLESRCASVTGLPVKVVLSHKNFESWLYASAETLELGLDYVPERSGLGEITSALARSNRKYVKPTWQPRLTARMDLSLASARDPNLVRLLSAFDSLRSLIT